MRWLLPLGLAVDGFWVSGFRSYLGGLDRLLAGVLAGVFASFFVAVDFESVFVFVLEVVLAGALSVVFVPPLGLAGVHALPGAALLAVTDTAKANVRRTAVVLRICIVLPWLDISLLRGNRVMGDLGTNEKNFLNR